MPTLNAVFKQVFGEALTPLGFKKIKSKYPYFVRVVEGGEIIHVLTCRSNTMGYPGIKDFEILGGVATVYRQRISLDLSPSANIGWLNGCTTFLRCSADLSKEERNAIFNSLYRFSYSVDDDESLVNSMKFALEKAKEFMLPILDNVTDIGKCIDYFVNYKLPRKIYYDKEFGNDKINNYYEEGLSLIKTSTADTFLAMLEKKIESELEIMARNSSDKSRQERRRFEDEEKPRRKAHYSKIFNDVEWCSDAMIELERRKSENLTILKSYGLNIIDLLGNHKKALDN